MITNCRFDAAKVEPNTNRHIFTSEKLDTEMQLSLDPAEQTLAKTGQKAALKSEIKK